MHEFEENDGFDYGKTGSVSGGGATYISLKKKEARFYIGKKGEEKFLKHPGFAGKLVGFDIQNDEGNKDLKIAPFWKLVLTVRSKDVLGESDEVKDYRFSIPATWHYEAFSFLNKAVCLGPSWNKYFSFSGQTYRPAGTDKTDARYFVNFNPDKKQDAERYPWVDNNQRFGPEVPDAVVLGTKDDGTNILSWIDRENFCLQLAKEFYVNFNAESYTGDVVPKPSKNQPASTPAAPPVIAPPSPPVAGTPEALAAAVISRLSSKERTDIAVKDMLDKITGSSLEKHGITLETKKRFEVAVSEAVSEHLKTPVKVLVNIDTGVVFMTIDDLPF